MGKHQKKQIFEPYEYKKGKRMISRKYIYRKNGRNLYKPKEL